jgi:hypothetical protein
MTSTEDLLRDVLDDLAPGAPADGRAYAGVGRAITRRRRRRAQVRMAAVAAVALAALGTAALVGRSHEQSGVATRPDVTTTQDEDRGPEPGTRPDGEEDPTETPDDGPDTVEGTVSGIGPAATFVLPAGWEVTEDEGSWGILPEQHPYTYFCLTRPEAAGTGECAVEIFHGEVPGEGNEVPYDTEAGWSWHRGLDVVVCPGGTDYNDIVEPVDGNYDPVQEGTRSIGGRNAIYSRWDVECSLSGRTFSPQGWYLADEQILILDVEGQPETEAILDSFSFDDEAD